MPHSPDSPAIHSAAVFAPSGLFQFISEEHTAGTTPFKTTSAAPPRPPARDGIFLQSTSPIKKERETLRNVPLSASQLSLNSHSGGISAPQPESVRQVSHSCRTLYKYNREQRMCQVSVAAPHANTYRTASCEGRLSYRPPRGSFRASYPIKKKPRTRMSGVMGQRD